MATKIQAALRAAVLVGSFAMVTGCARVTTEQLDAVRATAEAAQNAANAAQRTATQAQQAASGAQSTANQALQAAQAAQACCDATNQRLDLSGRVAVLEVDKLVHLGTIRIREHTGLLHVNLTVVTVLATKVDFGTNINLAIAMLIAVVKATLVVLFFMHLKYDNKILSYCFYAGLILALSVYIAVLTAFRFWWSDANMVTRG